MENSKHILELGCGKGRNAAVLAKKSGTKVVGVDLSEENIQIARTSYPELRFEVGSAEELNFPDASFDEIYAYDIFEHVDDLPKCALEAVRVLKPKGKLIVNVPAPASERWLLKVRPSYFDEIHHVRIFEGNQMQDLFESNGLNLVKKQARDFSDHVILYYVFKTTKNSDSQLGIGNWRDTWLGRILFGVHAYTKPSLVFSSPLKYVPIWLVTIPFGLIVNFFGNKYFPKSIYYEFVKP